ncbi:MAG: type VI secretion system baseplate subunit TssK [Myxococcota bacterium]|nr:type VI secretion system baseplate subunit TssK [Myxococcota bacterium]
MAIRKVNHQTARVYWQIGQALLPEHFYAQEHSLREESNLRFTNFSLPQWGLASIEWDPFQFLEGIVSLKELTLVLPSGVLVDIPGNTQPNAMNLNIAGSSQVSLYLHLQSGFETLHSGDMESEDEESIDKILQRIQLSASPYSETSLHSFKLGDFEKDVDGVWSLSQEYIPPTVSTQRSPFFDHVFEKANSITEAFHQALVDDIQEHYLGGASLFSAKQCLRGLYEFQAILANLDGDIRYHPYDIFRAMHGFYLDVSIYREKQPPSLKLVYDHQGLGPLFNTLLDELENLIRTSRTKMPYAPFQINQGLLVCKLPPEASKAKEVYWLLQKERVGSQMNLNGFKLAGESRIQMVHQLSLGGIALQKVETPPFHHTFGAEVEFYKLNDGEEWDYAVRDGALAFFDRPELSNTRSFMYWRVD